MCVCVCEHSHGQTYTTLIFGMITIRKDFGAKGLTIGETREVRERSGVFIFKLVLGCAIEAGLGTIPTWQSSKPANFGNILDTANKVTDF